MIETKPSHADVLFASSNFPRSTLRGITAMDMIAHAHGVGYDGVEFMPLRPRLQRATRNLLSAQIEGVGSLLEPWQLYPKWTSLSSVKGNIKFRAGMPSTHVG